ncbi:MAG: cupredoxin domain-containing protein [Actinomycetota bacterium]
MRPRGKYVATILVLLALGLAACSDDASRDTAEIEVINIAFEPATLRISAGAEVTWTNLDQGVRHTATSGVPGDGGVPGLSEERAAQPDGTFDGDLPHASSSFSFAFDEAGSYAYFCRVHPSMTGEIVVE